MARVLTTKQKRFVDNYTLKGMSISESVRRAGYNFKSGKTEDYGSYGCKLLKQDRIVSYVKKLRDKSFEKEALTYAEKRAFLARTVRADLTSKVDGDLIQELKEEVDSEGNVKRSIKLASKMDAIKEDNKMTHVYEEDKVASNPFLFLVTLGKKDSDPIASLPSVSGNVIEAEIVP
jgi:phage terminase small subunit